MNKAKSFLVLLSMTLLLANCSGFCSFETGKQLELEGKTTEALACYKSIIHTKDSLAAFERLSILYGHLGDYDAAITYGKRVFASNPRNLSNKLNLGDWYFKNDQAGMALNYFLMIERVDSLFPGLNYNLAVVYLTKYNSPQMARIYIEREVRNFSYTEKNYALMGQIYFQLKFYKKSEISYSQAIIENPMNANYYFQRAILYYYWDKYSGAISDLDTALTLDPNFVDAMLLKIDIGIEVNASFVCDLINQVEKYSSLTEELLELKNGCAEK